jgi:hypothetical protein
MKLLLPCSLLLLAASCSNDTTPVTPPKQPDKPVAPSDPDLISFTAPGGWIKETPSNNMRKAQYRVPDREKKAADATFTLSKLTPQPFPPNLERWAMQMGCDVPKFEEFKETHKVYFAQLDGEYRSDSGDEVPAARMLGAMVDTGEAAWFFKLVGPADTVGDYKDDFLKMVKAAK